tara:strand:+ start:92 stop:751 length:660 start_codon:yes stop_codon:yes gene_type:complete
MIKYLKAVRGSYKDKGSVDSSVIQSFFNKTQNLMFDNQAAELEQHAVLNIIKNIQQRRVLDLGCGDGRYSDVIDEYDFYQGVDFADSFIKKCKAGSEKNFTCAEITEYLSDQKFNIVLLIGVITYLEDEDVCKLSKNIESMLSDNAVVILRSVTLKDKGLKKLYYDSGPWNWLFRLCKPRYQMIRRSAAYELSLFSEFQLKEISEVEGTSYTLYTMIKE